MFSFSFSYFEFVNISFVAVFYFNFVVIQNWAPVSCSLSNNIAKTSKILKNLFHFVKINFIYYVSLYAWLLVVTLQRFSSSLQSHHSLKSACQRNISFCL